MKTEIERAKENIKEYRKVYGQSQLPTDCIVQLMILHAKSEQLILSSVVVPKGTLPKKKSKCCGRCIDGIDTCIYDIEQD